MKSFRTTTVVLGAVAAVALSTGAAFAGTAPARAPAASASTPATAARSHHRVRHERAATPAPVTAAKKKS